MYNMYSVGVYTDNVQKKIKVSEWSKMTVGTVWGEEQGFFKSFETSTITVIRIRAGFFSRDIFCPGVVRTVS